MWMEESGGKKVEGDMEEKVKRCGGKNSGFAIRLFYKPTILTIKEDS